MKIKQIQQIKPTEISFKTQTETVKKEEPVNGVNYPLISGGGGGGTDHGGNNEIEDQEEEEEKGMKGRYEDFIGIYENAVPDEFCDDVRKAIDYYTANDSLHIGDDQFPNSCAGRFDYSIDLYHMGSAVDGRADRDLNQWIFECYSEYAHVFGHLKPQVVYSTNQKCQMTPAGGGYHVWHDENSGPLNPDSARTAVWMLYLNDGFEGGETEFLYYKKRIPPKQGTLLIWPSGLTHAHKGNMVLSGSKYVVTGWFIRAPGANSYD